MRIIHFVPFYPPEPVGGVGEYAARLHRALLDAGHESLVVTRGRRSEPTVRRIARSRLGWLLGSVLWARRAAGYDVVHTHQGEALPLMLLVAARRRRARLLTTFHVSYAGVSASLRPYRLEGRGFRGGPWLYRTLVCWAHRAVDAVAARLADARVAITEWTAGELKATGAPESARVIRHGFAPLALPVDAKPPVELLYVGLGGVRKRVNALAFVLERVRRALPDARLRIAGFELAQEPELRALLDELGLLDCVECVGPVASAALPAHYASAGVLVVPSAYEGLALVILEGMQCGLPPVATRVGGHAEAIEHGLNGFLVELDRPEQIAERCVEILRDPELRGRLGAAARRTVEERFGMQRHLREYLALYESLARERR